MTRVVHVDDNVDGAVYIGRPMRGRKGSPFANPFRIGHAIPTFEGLDGRKATRRDVIIEYELWIKSSPQRHLLSLLPDLRGKVLACWCRRESDDTPDEICHGDVLVRLLDTYSDDELREWS